MNHSVSNRFDLFATLNLNLGGSFVISAQILIINLILLIMVL